MRKLLPVLAVVMGCVSTGRAQETPAWQVFGGYSIQRADVREYHKQTPIIYNFRGKYANLSGFEFSVAENKNRHLGGVFDISAHFRTPSIGGVTNRQQLYSLLYGPRVTYALPFGIPFAHVLLGAAYSNVKVTPTGPHDSDLAFAVAAGGGFDLKIGTRMAIRVIQADYFRSSVLGTRPHGVRASTGLVWNLGTRN